MNQSLLELAREIERLKEQIRRVSLPEAPVFVGAYCRLTTAQTINPNTWVRINFNTVIYDSHGRVTPGPTWEYVCPLRGVYIVTARLQFSAQTWPTGSTLNLALYDDSTQLLFLDIDQLPQGGTFRRGVMGTSVLRLDPGAKLSIQAFHTGPSSVTETQTTYIMIARLPGIYP